MKILACDDVKKGNMFCDPLSNGININRGINLKAEDIPSEFQPIFS